ncbi:hypothetical protein BUE80_DR003147 [Diplocarpon rosae]|nr:hypothetical protein BUE80_DR003147 [Diplocarpon rosae]
MVTSRTTRADSDLGPPASAGCGQPSRWTRIPLYNPVPALLAGDPIIWATCWARQVAGQEVHAVDFFPPLGQSLLVLVMISSASRALESVRPSPSRAVGSWRPSNPHPSDLLHPQHEDIASRPSWRTILRAAAYPCWARATVATISSLQSPSHLILWVPAWRLVSLSVAAVLAPVWHGSQSLDSPADLLLLAAFTFFGILYIDILHAAMTNDLDGHADQNYLSTSPVTHAALTLLALFQLTTRSIYAYGTGRSPSFWILGVGGWAVSCVWHIQEMSSVEWLWNERAGEAAVMRNVWLGAWLVGAEVGELWGMKELQMYWIRPSGLLRAKLVTNGWRFPLARNGLR